MFKKLFTAFIIILATLYQGKTLAQKSGGGGTSDPATETYTSIIYFDGLPLEIQSSKIFSGNTLQFKLNYSNPVASRFSIFKCTVYASTLDGQSWALGANTGMALNQIQSVNIPLNVSNTCAYITISVVLTDYGPGGNGPIVNYKMRKQVASNNVAFLPGSFQNAATRYNLVNSYCDTIKMNKPTGGISNRYKYQWQVLNSSLWTNLLNDTASSLRPQLVDYTKKYRRIALSDTALVVDTNVVAVGPEIMVCAVNKTLIHSDNEILPFNSSGALVGEAVTLSVYPQALPFVAPSISVAYQWQKSINGVFNDVAGATGKDLPNTGALTDDALYRRRFDCMGLVGYSNEVYLSLLPQTLAGAIALPVGNRSYTRSFQIKTPGVNNMGQLYSLSPSDYIQTSNYLDGLGRPLQNVQWKASPGDKDLVQVFEYDALGREVKKYLPYADQNSSDGNYKASALTAQANFYNTPPSGVKSSSSPFSVTVFEPSPINRAVEQGAPGSAWQPVTNSTTGHTIKTGFSANVAGEVKKWEINSSDNGAAATVYLAGSLYKTIVKDENWQSADVKAGTAEEFKDMEDRVVLKRMWETDSKSLDTYYVYDDLGSLRYVLPPAVNENGQSPVNSFDETQPVFDQFIYGYHYDVRKRVVEKKIPGKGWEFMVYNTLDELVMSQDAVQRAKSPQEWNFSKYDAFGRVVISGRYLDDAHGGLADVNYRTYFQALAQGAPAYEKRDGTNAVTGYSNTAIPLGSIGDFYVLNYYDDYDFVGNNFGQPSTGQAPKENTKGLLTGRKVKNLGTGTMLLTVNYYDFEGRVLQSKSEHQLNGADVVDNSYNFDGSLKASTRTHTANSASTVIASRYEYDHMGRSAATYKNINNGGEIALNKLDYNEIGQLKTKWLHGNYLGQQGVSPSVTLNSGDVVNSGQNRVVVASNSITLSNGFEAKAGAVFVAKIVDGTFLQHTDFAYNERGWMKTSTSPQFSYELKYQDGTTPQFNGNIANQTWGANGTNPNSFTYGYDKLNRLLSGISTGIVMSEVLTYDVMGNIASLNRNGASGTYDYTGTGNKLKQVTGGLATGVYTYDANGNAKIDGRAGVTLTYNPLNLPATVNKSGLTMAYTYDATGDKLKKVSNGVTRDYIDGIEYDGGNIDIIHTEEGLARRSGTTYSYEYNLTDHLGNVRLSFYKNPSSNILEVLQQTNYYPFGKTLVAKDGPNKYLYNGKELQQELGQLDYGARFYDPEIGRWNVVDPLAELDRKTNSYAYVFNNPMRFIDPTGMKGESTHTNSLGKVIAIYDDGDLGVYKHGMGATKEDVAKARNESGTTSGGGEYMGDTWTPFGFADFGYYEKNGVGADGSVLVGQNARIDFDSNWAFYKVRDILSSKPSAWDYSKKAGGSGPWDVKAHVPEGEGVYYGSKLYGKYASARDAGNFAAGAVAQSSLVPNIFLDYGFGTYNQSGNSKVKSLGIGFFDLRLGTINPIGGLGVLFYRANYGEDKLSKMGIEAGKSFIRNRF